jgi:hypothetical protein
MQTPTVVNALSLVAVDKAQGYAFVRNGDGAFFAVQPPYVADTITCVSSMDMEDVFKRDYGSSYESGEELSFPSWKTLLEWLDKEFVAERTRLGIKLPSSADTEYYFRQCSAEDVRCFLDIVRGYLPREEKHATSRNLLRRLLETQAVRNDEGLRTEILELQDMVRESSPSSN